MMELEERERRIDYIEELNPTERGVYAHMIMRSLRGSWRKPRARTHVLELIARTRDVAYFDAEQLREWVRTYFEKIGRGDDDGRYWRRHYEDADVDVTVLSESKVRELASHIPNDMTWDDFKFDKEFGDE